MAVFKNASLSVLNLLKSSPPKFCGIGPCQSHTSLSVSNRKKAKMFEWEHDYKISCVQAGPQVIIRSETAYPLFKKYRDLTKHA